MPPSVTEAHADQTLATREAGGGFTWRDGELMRTTLELPDLNVWLALACPDHGRHCEAVHYWEQKAAEQVLFCTVAALGLVRLWLAVGEFRSRFGAI